ncbi:aspartate aminotransferase family protein [Natrarchaeobius halalkaliphilus]|uniref:Aspartate aminotransferase family protein n=1 Tax=Natrarchaeobius halalkaliphilus TaxID=1679091 RepID=A0A3N6NVY1_9EURY|nr:aminotransferase class III-fold pyridoxal phosphate-dependent enzyme [Natrarchaeobius halalkaliphilus]RQG88072.1 aspartate aminotransferase family protein [Natrarchaeobius halalkaliphilus]
MQQDDVKQAAASRNTVPHWFNPDHPHLDIRDGDGAYVTDADGNRYLDGVSQLFCVNAGFDNQTIIDAMVEQLHKAPYVTPSQYNDTRQQLSEAMLEKAPDSMGEVYFAVSGSEANEAAVHFAREYTGSHKILTRWRSYHGWNYGTSSLTGNGWSSSVIERNAATTGAQQFLPPMSYRSPFDADTPEELAEKAADHVEFVIRNEGPDSVAAILMEPIAGASGAYTAPPGYFERLRELCDTYDILLIADEVITGFGRCGEWFGIQTENVEPDMITCAKGLTSAYAPLAGVMVSSEISEYLRDDGVPLGQTFGGHPVGCAAGLAAISEYENGLLENVRSVSPYLEERLRELEDAHDVVGNVRGRGFLWSLAFSKPGTEEPVVDPRTENTDNPVEAVADHAATDGDLLVWPGRPQTQIMVAPPFCLTRADVDQIHTALDGAIESVFSS